MNLAEHYRQMYEDSLSVIRSQGPQTDELIDSPEDTRRGITLLTRPPQEVKAAVHAMLERLRGLEPDQYYYPDEDIHLTVLSIITCRSGFTLEEIVPQDYIRLIQNTLRGLPPIGIRFRGITLSPGCVMLQGYPDDDTLNRFRDRLRDAFRNSPLRQTLDQRYTLQTAHSTVVRFRCPFRDTDAFLSALESCREQDFGSFRVDRMELVLNDWYQRRENTRELCHFQL
ncbi:MAG: mutarotase [Verrucomicrobia bacterium]|nr:mutarotase [Verrucomicrobiota bacterium]